MRHRLTICLLLASLNGSAADIVDEDFEVGDLSSWLSVAQTNGTVRVTTDLPHSGIYSAKHVLNAGTVNTLMRVDFPAIRVAYGRVFFYVDPEVSITGDLQILQLLNASSFIGQRVYLRNTAGTLYLKLEGQLQPGLTAITKGAWHSVELKCDSKAGTATVYADGSDAPELSASGLAFGVIDVMRVGFFGTATGTIYFDDVAVNSSAIGAPSSSIIVRHADSFGRTALPLLTTFWGWTNSDQVTAEVDGTEVQRIAPLTSGRVSQVIDLSRLSMGEHTLTVRLIDSSNALKAQFSDGIKKYRDGVPTVSIDGNNSLSLNGSLIFPVTPFMQNPSDWAPYWSNRWVNLYGWSSGYAGAYSPGQYQEFIEAIGQPSIGPNARFCNSPVDFCVNEPNAVDLASAYVTLLKNHRDVFMWTWCDEPDLGGTTPRILPSMLQAVTNALHDIDGNHPQALNLYGYDPAGTRKKNFLHPNLVADVYSFDYYPMISGNTFASWVEVMDQYQRYNFGLTPWFTFVEAGIQPCSDPPTCTGGRGPTATQLRMEAWLAVIHGMKGISWWGPEVPSYTYIDSAHKAQMATFVNQIGRLKNVVLSAVPSRSVIDNSNAAGNRVDTMIREDGTNVWVFAARLTEIGEVDTLTTQFTVSGLSGSSRASVFDENRYLSVVDGILTDSFAPNAVHIYRIPMTAPAPPQALRVIVQ